MSPPAHSGDTRWLDGLRGLASFLVVNAHIARSIAPILLSPCIENASPLPWQLPLVRNMFMGRASIAIFAIVSGFVSGLKATRLTREGQVDVALPYIAKTAFRRTGRFILPSVVATFISWLLCQIGVFNLAHLVSWGWLRDTSPIPSEGFIEAMQDLFLSLGKTWIDGGSHYDPVQWTLCYLLRGSMLVYLTLFATAYVKPKHRYGLYAIMWMYYFWLGDAVIGMNIYLGLFLAEMTNDPNFQPILAEPGLGLTSAAICVVATGLFFISYPEMNNAWAGWSLQLHDLGTHLFPEVAELERYWPCLGAQLVVLGLFFIPQAKNVLRFPPLAWMGKVSFGVYLLHGPLMRSLLTYMVFGWSPRPAPEIDEETGELRQIAWILPYNNAVTCVAVFAFYLVLYKLAGLWVKHVDPACSNLANRLEQWLFVEGEAASEKPSQPTLPAGCFSVHLIDEIDDDTQKAAAIEVQNLSSRLSACL